VGVGRSSATVEFFYYSWRPPAANCSGNGVEVHGKARLPSADDLFASPRFGGDRCASKAARRVRRLLS
jgi:hypothetical protein